MDHFVEFDGFPNLEDQVGASAEFYEYMKRRRTIREFEDTPVDDRIIQNAILAAGTAPSGANKQPWKFAVIRSPEIKAKLRVAAEEVEQEFYSKLAPREWLDDLKFVGTDANKPYLETAPAIIAVFAKKYDRDEDGDRRRVYYPIESTGIAVGFLLAALHHCGLATLTHTPKPMKFLSELLGIDSSYMPYMLVVTGYPKKPIVVPKITKKKFDEIADIF